MTAAATVPMLIAGIAPIAMSSPDAAAQRTEASELARLATGATSAVEADRQARACLVDPYARLTGSGWRHDEIARVVSLRCASRAPASVLDDIVVIAGRPGTGWWGASPWFSSFVHRSPQPVAAVVAVAALAEVLASLEPLPLFDPLDDTDLDSGVLRKVRALLAKAESTDFEAEADALTAKAQDLITRHALDELHLDSDQRTEVRSRRIPLDAPYASAKSILLAQIASANRCRSVQCRFTETAIVIGVPADLSAVEVLYTSLLTQATSAMLSAGSVGDGRGRSRTRSFRRSFLLGFAQRVGVRLAAASSAAVDQSPAASILPALRARSTAVDEAMRRAFPSAQKRRVSHSNGAGYGAGDRAGASADLGASRVRGSRAGLPRPG